MGTMNNTGDTIALERASQLAKDMLVNIESALRGKPEVVMQTVICVIARGHLLIEDVPGVARRRWRGQPLSRSMPISIGIQFTSDLLPSDLTGISVPEIADGRATANTLPVPWWFSRDRSASRLDS